MMRDGSACNTYNYADAFYWDARYEQEANFDWYQRYSALRPFILKHISSTLRVLMVGCGNAGKSPAARLQHAISEDMVKDGFEDIMNIDISSVAIEMMGKKHEHVPQLKYMQMDVRDMSFFSDDSFDSIIDKGTLDAVMCGTDAPISASQMLGEVSRLLKPGGVYILITYGDPIARMPHINRNVYNWKIELYIMPIPEFQRPAGSTSLKSLMEPVPITDEGLLPADYVIEDPDSHFIYVCKKVNEPTDFDATTSIHLPDDAIQR